MIKSDFKADFLQNFHNLPTTDQMKALDSMTDFIFDNETNSVFLLKGFAGTGKTSMLAAMVRTMERAGMLCVLLAPTGRAAKVFSHYAGHPAYTIHKMIYRQRTLDINPSFSLGFNAMKNVMFIVDEASMISDVPSEMRMRESLLESLLHFVYGNDRGCRLMLLGDTAQLPPVGEADSPALRRTVLERYGMKVAAASLTTVVRQDEQTGILWNATRIRTVISRELFGELPKIRFSQFADVVNIPGDQLIETLSDCYRDYGLEETMVVCRSNKRANIYNNGIRGQILWRESELETGDLVMVAKNNYFWVDKARKDTGIPAPEDDSGMEFIANGDIAVVQRVRNIRELFGFKFADCTLLFPDYDDELDATVLLDTLQAEAPALTPQQNEQLFNKVMEDYMDIPLKQERLKKMRQDPFYNALQLKYAYAVTCHKAQGGQWTNIFIDQGYLPEDTSVKDYCRWLYTAMTRATTHLYLVNWKESQSE